MDFQGVNKLEDRTIKKGEKWIFSAGFNVKSDLKNTERIDTEIEDIKQILNSDGIVIILTHQVGSNNEKVEHLDFIADYLSKRLETKVKYFRENTTNAALNFVKSLKPKEIVIMGNTRFHKGEQKNDPKLVYKFSKLGDFIAVGGFSKAHRSHASNVGILDFKQGFITRSQIKEMKLLSPWSGKKLEYSVAILGGIKKEKIQALINFSKTYDVIIPGGIVLNTILKAKGFKIGGSTIEDEGKTFEKEVEEVLNKNFNKICIPSKVFITKKNKDSKLIDISKGVPPNYHIVDFILDKKAEEALEKAVNTKGRILLAGTPTFYSKGFKNATNKCLLYLNNPQVKSIILGGDSTREIPFKGIKSIGGGSALEFLYKGTTTVYEALKRNKEIYKDS